MSAAEAGALSGVPSTSGQESLVATVVRSQLTAPDREVRVAALDGLVGLAAHGDDEARALLREVVTRYRDTDREVYTRALNRVEVFGDRGLTEPLLAALSDEDLGCQAWAADACGRLGVQEAAPLLVGLLTHPDGMVRASACEALGELRNAPAVGALATCVDDPSEHVRAAASRALARIGTDAAADALWAAFLARRHPRPGYLPGALAACGPDVHARLLAATAHADPEIRYWAARALGATGDERYDAVLSRLAADDHATTSTGARVSTGARRGLRASLRVRERDGEEPGQPSPPPGTATPA
ncbi:hypothetical protein GC089_16735 [Cellulomonas sp. JZ18]|uniref:HEAT repeat domain-containing protein n=1 Tax=Cellulomonas sp. JZ18 TaxID=2654191 RepID=UPI0012D3DD12|nr:HEAT repeat domain-containing protein [Cellulomonas sp. JZ18]QGQ20531.1 hypothetical protein GC089_16735 [Cellulomonas sp. JZ18]